MNREIDYIVVSPYLINKNGIMSFHDGLISIVFKDDNTLYPLKFSVDEKAKKITIWFDDEAGLTEEEKEKIRTLVLDILDVYLIIL